MSKFKLCFIFDENGDYKPVPYSKLMDGHVRREEYNGRYFIPLNGYLLEVNKEDYYEHYKTVNRQNYLRKEAKRVGVIPIQYLTPENAVSVESLYEDMTEQVISDIMIADLHTAIAQLKEDDERIIRLLYFEQRTERQCAEIFGISQQAVSKRKKKVLKQLATKLMD